jgi:type I restriction enzyme R subunit
MAPTGTGKTFLTVAQVYRLLESKKFKRILFLVDRKALAAQFSEDA